MKRFLAIAMAFVLLAAVTFTGCTGFQEWYGSLPSVCDEIPAGESVLCGLADKAGVRLEEFGSALVAANSVAIGQDLYTVDQYKEVINKILDLMGYEGERSFITYEQLREGIYKIASTYPGLVEIATSYLDMFIGQSGVVTVADKDIITKFLVASLHKV